MKGPGMSFSLLSFIYLAHHCKPPLLQLCSFVLLLQSCISVHSKPKKLNGESSRGMNAESESSGGLNENKESELSIKRTTETRHDSFFL